jgi:hypothetical protein
MHMRTGRRTVSKKERKEDASDDGGFSSDQHGKARQRVRMSESANKKSQIGGGIDAAGHVLVGGLDY